MKDQHDSAQALLEELRTNKDLQSTVAKKLDYSPNQILAAANNLQISRGIWERIVRYALYTGCAAGGILLVWASTLISEYAKYDFHELHAKFCEHLGVALIVAVVVAGVFHVAHERELIKQPLGEIESNIERVRKETFEITTVLQNKTQEIALTVTGFNNIMKFAQEKGITGAFNADTEEWRNAILNVITEAEEFIYIEARTLRPFLTKWEGEPTGWLGPAIEKQLKENKSLYFALLLSDVFDMRGRYREELKLIFPTPELQKNERSGCRASVEWILKLEQQLKGLKDTLHSTSGDSYTPAEDRSAQIALRLLHDAPPLFLVMSEKSAIIGHYIPFKPITSVRMLGINGEANLFKDYRDHFESFFAIASDPVSSIGQYIDRKRRDQDKDKDARLEFERWQKNQKIAESVSSIYPQVMEILEQRQAEQKGRDYSSENSKDNFLVADPAVVRTYHRNDSDFVEAVQRAIDSRDSPFIYILGRCHASMLGRGDTDATGTRQPPWLRDLLKEKLIQPNNDSKIIVILPDTFSKLPSHDSVGSYKSELAAIAKHKRQMGDDVSVADLRNATRRTVDALIDLKTMTQPETEQFAIRLCQEVPRICMVMTDCRAFVEMYLPGHDGGSCKILELQHDDSRSETSAGSYQAFKEYFLDLNNSPTTQDAIPIFHRYCDSHKSDFAEIRQARLERYYDAYPDEKPLG